MYDVIVTGLGAMGSSAIYQLAGRGKRVLGLEQFTPGHDKGSSHGHSRIIRQAIFEHPTYVPLALRAYELWERLQEETGQDLMALTGGLMVGNPDSELVRGTVRSAKEHGLPYELLDVAEIRRRYPVLTPSPGMVAVYEEQTGIVRPEATVRAYLERARALGAEMHFEEPVLSWEAVASGDRVRVQTPHGSYEAERLVITAGPWAPRLLRDLGLPLEVTRMLMYWFEPLGGVEPFLPGHFPVANYEPDDGNKFTCWPVLDDEPGLKATFIRSQGVPCTPETLDRHVHEEEIEFMRRYLAEYVPAAAGHCLGAVACMYTNTPDKHFVIDLYPDYPQVSFASPCSGHGFKYASVIGEIMADLATEGSTGHPIQLFSPARLSGYAPEGRP